LIIIVWLFDYEQPPTLRQTVANKSMPGRNMTPPGSQSGKEFQAYAHGYTIFSFEPGNTRRINDEVPRRLISPRRKRAAEYEAKEEGCNFHFS
jgi:hypothetical protein